MILKNLKTNKYLILSEYRVAFKKKMPGLLGGFVDNNETPLQCIKREAKEEIGIKPKNIKFLNKFVRNSNYHCGIDHVFYGETETINLTMESNISYFWISENELKNKFLKKNLFKNPGFFSAVTLYLLSKKKL